MVDSAPRVLVIDDDALVVRTLTRALSRGGFAVEHLMGAAEIETLFTGGTEVWDAIVLDISLGEISGLDVLARLRATGDRTAVVMLTGDATAATATQALRGGAFDYLVKPLRPVELIGAVERAVRQTAIHRALSAPGGAEGGAGLLIGRSPAMQELRRMVPRIADANVSVLIVGESGTGKEVVARALHQASPRAHKAFVPINCGAIPEGLIDSELFGHARGAFTGAVSARPGVFVEADGGTLFLDEIGDMPLPVQARLLRALQEREVRAVGGGGVRTVDVRVIAATNVDLARAVQEGRFRADLFFRLNVVSVRVPPLRERPEDVPQLTAVLLRRHAEAPPEVAPDALEALMAYPWPGNVRELENALQHALTMTRGGQIDAAALPAGMTSCRATRPEAAAAEAPDVADAAELDPELSLTEAKRRAAAEFERTYLMRLLEQSRGSISAAARTASIDRTNFRRLLQRHNIDPERYRD